MKEINKVMAIGANCIGANCMKYLGIREPGPMDNIANFPIAKAYLLFNNKLKDDFFKYKYIKRESTKLELDKFHFEKNIYIFRNGCSIVHNDFENKHFKRSLKKRLSLFEKYYKKSQKDESFWYIYSLNFEDKFLKDIDLIKIYKTLPKCCSNRLICLGIRERNPLFEKYFKYYIEFNDEADYQWNSCLQAAEIAKILNQKYGLQFNISEK